MNDFSDVFIQDFQIKPDMDNFSDVIRCASTQFLDIISFVDVQDILKSSLDNLYICKVELPTDDPDFVYVSMSNKKIDKWYANKFILGEKNDLRDQQVFFDLIKQINFDDSGYAMRWASINGHIQIVNFLIENGADVHALNDIAIKSAIENHHINIAKLLLDVGVNIVYNDIIYRASIYGHLDILEHILNLGVPVKKFEPAVMKSIENRHLHIIKFLADIGVDFEEKSHEMLCIASENGDYDTTKYILDNYPKCSCDFPLRCASDMGHLHIVKLLIDNGANIHSNDDAALQYAARGGHLDVVKFLVENGANIHANSDYAFRTACDSGYISMIEYLVDIGGIFVHVIIML